MEAIQACGAELIAAYDIFDSVGILDRYFPDTAFFTEFERFDRHIDKLQRRGTQIDYLVICSPNYLHDAHIRYGIRNGIKVICEKPVVLNTRNLNSLIEIEAERQGEVNSLLQLRLHPEVIKLKESISKNSTDKKEVELSYITSRGNWYYSSWKGDESKSGGICTNIGIHFFDMLIFLFGKVEKSIVTVNTHDRSSGILHLEHATVKWFLSINRDTLPPHIKEQGQSTFRSLTIGDQKFDFSKGFENLHILSYQKILNGQGFKLAASQQSIELVEQIRSAEVVPMDDAHYLTKLPITGHPFKIK